MGGTLDRHGYRARYRLVALGQVVGHAEVWLGPVVVGRDRAETRTLRVEAHTEGTFARLLPADGVYEATLDATTLAPRQSSMTYRRPGRAIPLQNTRGIRTRLVFDPAGGTVTRTRGGRSVTFPAPPGTHDPLSWLLALAARRPTQGDRVSFPLVAHARRLRVAAEVGRTRRLATPMGITEARRAVAEVLVWWPEPRLPAGAPHRPRRRAWAVTVWLDANSPSGLPARVETSLSWAGPLRIDLERTARVARRPKAGPQAGDSSP